MSVISVPVVDARALLDEEDETFTIEVRLASGAEVRFSSQPGPETIASLKMAMTEPVKPKRKRARRKPEAAEE